MEDYRFETTEPMLTNLDIMAYFLNSNKHFYARFDNEAQVTLEDVNYAEVENGDGKKYAVYTVGDRDFHSHRIRFESLT